MKYHGPLYGKILNKYIPLKHHSDDVDKLKMDLESQRQLAGELIASIRINFARGLFIEANGDQIEAWLQPFIARLIPYKAPTARKE